MANLHNTLGMFTTKQAIDIAMVRLVCELKERLEEYENINNAKNIEASNILCQFISTLPKKCQEEVAQG